MLATLIAQLCLLAYHQTTTWIDLFPFNGVRFTKKTERWGEAVTNVILMGLPPIGYAFNIEGLIRFGVIYYFVLFAIECATWWAPYFFGASLNWEEIYLRVHAQTVALLPRRGRNPAPNLEHLILMVLTLVAAFFTLREFLFIRHENLLSLWIGWVVGGLLTLGTLYQMVHRGAPKGSA